MASCQLMGWGLGRSFRPLPGSESGASSTPRSGVAVDSGKGKGTGWMWRGKEVDASGGTGSKRATTWPDPGGAE